MTPNEIITREIQKIHGIRLPAVRMAVERIFRELSENGYSIVEKTEVADDLPQAHPKR